MSKVENIHECANCDEICYGIIKEDQIPLCPYCYDMLDVIKLKEEE